MSPDELNEMEQLDGLAGELIEAGRVARVAIAGRQRPEPAFAMRLRAGLLRELPSGRALFEFAPAPEGEDATPRPPIRPLNLPDGLIERRRESRPFAEESRARTLSPDVEILAPGPGFAPDAADASRAGECFTTSGDEVGDAAPPVSAQADEAGHVAALHPSVHWRIPTRVMPSRWTAAGLAASVAIVTLLYGSGIFSPMRAQATADVAVSATLVRDGAASTLATGADLREGDEIRVASGGRATLTLGASIVRLDSGADLRLDSLDPNHEAVSQLAGRVYHRVRVASGGDYRVVTGSVSWAARGTAFDLERSLTGGGGEQVRGLALQHGVDLTGPQIQATLEQGAGATIQLLPDGAPGGSPVVEAITSETLASGWLIDNAGLDARLGLPLGLLADLATPAPLVTPAPPTDQAAPPTEQAGETPSPTLAPTPAPTPAPTQPPTPKPTPAGPANLGQLKITRNGDGTYKFQWPKYTGSGFQYYKLVHGPAGSQPSFPASPYWACNDTPGNTVWSGPIDAGDYAVRLQVVDESGGKTIIRAQTNVVRLTALAPPSLPPTVDLGALAWTPNVVDGTYTFSWTQYTGGPFSYYKLVYGTWPGSPSYPSGSPYWAVPPAGAGSSDPIAIPPGEYAVRIQAIGYPGGHAYAYAQTAVLHLVVPAPTPTP
jgi:hypothetical protein